MSHPARPMKRPRLAKFETDGRTRPVAGYRREPIVPQAEKPRRVSGCRQSGDGENEDLCDRARGLGTRPCPDKTDMITAAVLAALDGLETSQ